MKFYTSVLPYRGRLLVRGVNHDGSHKKFRINYKPSLFVPSGKESKYKTLDGRNVGQVTFESMPETKKWIDQYKDVSGFEYYGNTRYQYPFIADEFKDKIDWVREHIHPSWIVIPTFKGSQKAAFAHKKAVLIDDYQDNIDNWVEAGGIGILHKTADDTIKQLNDIINAE